MVLVAVTVASLSAGVVAALPAGATALGTVVQLQVTASGNTNVGLTLFANVQVAGGTNPTGTLTFSLFGSSDPNCLSSLFTSVVQVTSTSVNSDRYVTSVTGTYRWEVSYSGDANNNPVGPTPCTNPSASVIVSPVTTGLGVYAAPPLASTIWATAHLGGYQPTGTVTFYLTPPGDMFCSGTPVFTSTVAVTGPGNYQSAHYPLPGGGQYKWRAIYSGDVNNQYSSVTSCLDPNAAVIVPPFAAFTYPVTGQANVDATAPFTWQPVAQASGYLLTVGTTYGGYDLAWSGVLPGSQASFNVGALPAGPLYGLLYTQINGLWSSYQTITFTATPTEAGFTSPISGQGNVATTAPFTWTTVPGVDGYAIWISTTYGTADLYGTGLIPANQSSLTVPTLPAGRTLYAMLHTRRNGVWFHQAVTFTTAGGSASSAAPASPAALVAGSARTVVPPCLPGNSMPGCPATQ